MPERYAYFKSEITGLYVINDKKRKHTFSGFKGEKNCKRIVNVLNNQEQELERLTVMNNELVDVIKGISKDTVEMINKMVGK